MKKIYIVETSVPGDFGGSPLRNFNVMNQLATRTDCDVEVYCVAARNPAMMPKEGEMNQKVHYRIVPRPDQSFIARAWIVLSRRIPPDISENNASSLSDAFRAACEKALPDIVQIEQLDAYYCIRRHIPWLKERGVQIVFDCHNVEFQAFADLAELLSPLKKSIARFLVPHLKRLEIEATRQADIVFACSERDAKFFRAYNPKTYVIPNGIDSGRFELNGKETEPTLVFTGGVAYSPNSDGLRFYIKDIHPRVKEQFPSVRLLMIGADKQWIAEKGIDDASVEPLGFVHDIRPYFKQASIGICPIQYGGGTRIKIMTYMAAGLPVVSTKKGAEGVDYVDGHDIVLADDPKEFADAIIRLLNDRRYYEEIARNGRDFIVKNYDWNMIGMHIAEIYQHELR